MRKGEEGEWIWGGREEQKRNGKNADIETDSRVYIWAILLLCIKQKMF